jgi:hypothetical protein
MKKNTFVQRIALLILLTLAFSILLLEPLASMAQARLSPDNPPAMALQGTPKLPPTSHLPRLQPTETPTVNIPSTANPSPTLDATATMEPPDSPDQTATPIVIEPPPTQPAPVVTLGLPATPPISSSATPPSATDNRGLVLREAVSFDDGNLVNWSLRPGWSLVPSEGGQALAVLNSEEAITYSLNDYSDVAVQARFLFSAGIPQITVRNSPMGGYAAWLEANGQVALFRGPVLLASSAVMPTLPGEWRTVRLEAVANQVRVVVDGDVVIDVQDLDPLPAGGIAISVLGLVAPIGEDIASNAVLVDDFELWGPQPLGALEAANTSVGDWVWLDEDADGIQDINEPGVPNVTVKIYKYRNGKTSGKVFKKAKTDAFGYYNITVPEGDYVLEVGLPEGYDLTAQFQGSVYYDSDFEPFTKRTPAYRLYAGNYYTTVDAGLVELYECDAVIDLMIIVDGSGSISSTNFNLIKAFSRGLVNSFVIGSRSAHMGVVQFASEGTGRVHKNLSSDRNGILTAINKMNQIGGLTDIQEGLYLAQDQIARRGRGAPVPRAIVLLTDGYDNEPGDPVAEAASAKGAGTVIYVVAVDSSYMTMINAIASDPDDQYVFEVTGLQQLVSALYELADATCGTPVRPVAPKLIEPKNRYLTNDSVPTTFAWTAVSDATQYEIQVAGDKNFTSPELDVVVDDTTHSMLLGLPDGRHYWRVRGVHGNVPGAWSKSRYFTIDTIPPAVPELRKPAKGSLTTNKRIRFNWKSVREAKTYQLQLGTTNPPLPIVQSSRSKGFTPPSPLLLTTYYWRVRAVDEAGNISGWSDIWSVEITSPANDRPILNRFTTLTPNLTWGLLTWAIGYEIEVDNNSNFRSPEYTSGILVGGVLEHTLTAPLDNGLWYWRIRAFDSSWRPGKWSSRGTFTIEAN